MHQLEPQIRSSTFSSPTPLIQLLLLPLTPDLRCRLNAVLLIYFFQRFGGHDLLGLKLNIFVTDKSDKPKVFFE